jgi:hypothetical protein
MRRLGRFRVNYFCDLLARERHQSAPPAPPREIVRRPGNPLLRYATSPPVASATDPLRDPVPNLQES